jgi:hypothetical protein
MIKETYDTVRLGRDASDGIEAFGEVSDVAV